MIDLHCHYLPGIDDGAQTLAQALELASAAVDDGITHAVLTPHVHPGVFENRRSGIAVAVERFRMELVASGIPLGISAGGEVRVGPEVMELLAAGELPFVGEHHGRRVLLLELPHGQVPVGADRLTAWLLKRNVLPLIAHPERNKDVMRSLGKLDPFIDQGCLLQVTAGSLLGHFGELAERRARELLDRGDVFVVATDAHNMENRPPVMQKARAFLAAVAGEPVAIALTRSNAAAILIGASSAEAGDPGAGCDETDAGGASARRGHLE